MNNTIIKENNDFTVVPFEKCIVCEKETDIPINLNVDHRVNYVEGAGQLCNTCYVNLNDKKIYKTMSELTKPNAFVFKALIDGKYKLCICRRINDKWEEDQISYIKDYDGSFDDVLDDKLFSIVFVGIEETSDGLKLKKVDGHFMKSNNDIAQEMYMKGNFFNTIEKGYQKFYEQPESSREGIETQNSEQGSI